MVWVSAYKLDHSGIAQALIAAHKRKVRVWVLVDKSAQTDKWPASPPLKLNGVPVYIDPKHAIFHHKVMVIDNATVITGSFNFTRAADELNAENLLILKDAPELVKAYVGNMQAHAQHAKVYQRRAARKPK